MRLYNCDFRDWLWKSEDKYKMIFADPPDNIDLSYEGYEDTLAPQMYRRLLASTLQALARCEILWVSFNPNHMGLMGSILENKDEWWFNDEKVDIRWFVQYVSFGYNMRGDFSRCFRPMVRLMREGAETYPDAVRIESDRQKMGDKRADPRGKIPPDVWAIHRVTGNSKQRRSWHNTQLNEALYERCLDFSCVPGDKVADLYAGTGTMMRAAEGKDLDVTLFDISETYCGHLAEEFNTKILLPGGDQ
jgi:DNA modification methylase